MKTYKLKVDQVDKSDINNVDVEISETRPNEITVRSLSQLDREITIIQNQITALNDKLTSLQVDRVKVDIEAKKYTLK